LLWIIVSFALIWHLFGLVWWMIRDTERKGFEFCDWFFDGQNPNFGDLFVYWKSVVQLRIGIWGFGFPLPIKKALVPE
jgi:hypothetical protein